MNAQEDIRELSYTELREYCCNAGLKASGNTSTLRKRLRAHQIHHGENMEGPVAKKHKNPADDLVCPITHELPFDPVTAMDGFVYERSAISRHISLHTAENLRSPMTNTHMVPELITAARQKSLIESLIDNGAITGDLAKTWQKKREEEQGRQELLKKANEGDVKSQEQLAIFYDRGKGGFRQDLAVGLKWARMAHQNSAGSAIGAYYLGRATLSGTLSSSYPKCVVLAMYYLTVAAENRSRRAAFLLGKKFATGGDGIQKDHSEAIRWLSASLELNDESPVDCLRTGERREASVLLSNLSGEEDANLS